MNLEPMDPNARRPQAVRHDRRDWRGSNYATRWPSERRRRTPAGEWCARLAFGIFGGAVMVGYLLALLYAPEIRHVLAVLHG